MTFQIEETDKGYRLRLPERHRGKHPTLRCEFYRPKDGGPVTWIDEDTAGFGIVTRRTFFGHDSGRWMGYADEKCAQLHPDAFQDGFNGDNYLCDALQEISGPSLDELARMNLPYTPTPGR